MEKTIDEDCNTNTKRTIMEDAADYQLLDNINKSIIVPNTSYIEKIIRTIAYLIFTVKKYFNLKVTLS